MIKITKEMIDDYANKLLIGLAKDENDLILGDFDDLFAEIELINKVPNLDKYEPMTYCLDDFECIPREDVAEEAPNITELLQNCDCYEDREVKLPKVVG